MLSIWLHVLLSLIFLTYNTFVYKLLLMSYGYICLQTFVSELWVQTASLLGKERIMLNRDYYNDMVLNDTRVLEIMGKDQQACNSYISIMQSIPVR